MRYNHLSTTSVFCYTLDSVLKYSCNAQRTIFIAPDMCISVAMGMTRYSMSYMASVGCTISACLADCEIT